ncbi:NlpC/P60 family protein [Salsuginibacillus kocurii]|uniref:NlpC/P60 family protein n=1 Tax=Salsuginibacillus kocurii TaxID=427078 RepID=UPI00036F926F|nr:NlpC/P60 family protein [Salsuginibacillus kocurii]
MKKFGLAIASVLILSLAAFDTEAEAANTSDQVIQAGEQQLGTPYQWGGTSPSGFDCSGFTRHAFSAAGIDLPRTAAEQYQVGTSVSRSDLQPGDLVFFNTSGSGVSHNGIYIGGNQFIHSSSSQGVSIASMSNTYWQPRYIGAKRVIEEQEESSVLGESGGEPVEVVVNGEALQLDQDAIINDGRTVIPMRAIFEELGATVDWNGADKSITGTSGDTTVSLTIGENTAQANGSSVTLDEPAQVVNERTMVPLRFIGETLGATVEWQSDTRTVVITQ